MQVRPGPWLSPAVTTRSDTPGSLREAPGRSVRGESVASGSASRRRPRRARRRAGARRPVGVAADGRRACSAPRPALAAAVRPGRRLCLAARGSRPGRAGTARPTRRSRRGRRRTRSRPRAGGSSRTCSGVRHAVAVALGRTLESTRNTARLAAVRDAEVDDQRLLAERQRLEPLDVMRVERRRRRRSGPSASARCTATGLGAGAVGRRHGRAERPTASARTASSAPPPARPACRRARPPASSRRGVARPDRPSRARCSAARRLANGFFASPSTLRRLARSSSVAMRHDRRGRELGARVAVLAGGAGAGCGLGLLGQHQRHGRQRGDQEDRHRPEAPLDQLAPDVA